MKKYMLALLVLLVAATSYATYQPIIKSAFIREDSTSSFYNLSTVFVNQTTANDSGFLDGIVVDQSAGTMTFSEASAGRYRIDVHASFRAPTGKIIAMGAFKNNTTIDQIVRGMAKGAERVPTFIGISSDGGDAVFDTQSTIDYLDASDGDDLIVIESGTGSTGCMFLKVQYSDIDIPSQLRISTSAYQSNNSNHWMNVKLLNYSSDAHVDVNVLSKDFEDVGASIEPYERVTWLFNVPSPQTSYVENGVSEALLVHNDVSCAGTHRMHLDETRIIDKLSSAVVAFSTEVDVVSGDVVRLKFKADSGGTEFFIDDMGLNIFRLGN